MGWVKAPNGGREKRRVGGATIRPPHGGVCQLVVSNVHAPLTKGARGVTRACFGNSMSENQPERRNQNGEGVCVERRSALRPS